MERTGFLSDYSSLQEHSPMSYRYLGPRETLRAYATFIIDPVRVYHHGGEAAAPSKDLQDLAEYFRAALIDAMDDAYPVVTTPGPGIARVRLALTNVKKSSWWMNLHPASKLTGAGTGEAAMEGEVVDSQTGAQLAALVESQRGSQFELDTLSAYDDARDVIDDWVKRFRARLDEIHAP